MRVVIVGLGVQGRKRLAVAGSDVVAMVDPLVPEATYRMIEQVPLGDFDAALVCTPDQTKPVLLHYLLAHGKHVLVEKPLLAQPEEIQQFAKLARSAGVAAYTAYNHRFEPHIANMKAVMEGGTLGQVYLVKGFYGNGTARDVRESSWRDEGLGVLSDLGSHLLDIVQCVFGEPGERFLVWNLNSFENRAYDRVAFGTAAGRPLFELEASLLSWRNTFRFEIYGERGSAHLEGLCKWGPSTLTVRRRILPSGKPQEETRTLERPDPTWALEYEHFARLCRTGGTNLENDLWINRVLHELVHHVADMAASAGSVA